MNPIDVMKYTLIGGCAAWIIMAALYALFKVYA